MTENRLMFATRLRAASRDLIFQVCEVKLYDSQFGHLCCQPIPPWQAHRRRPRRTHHTALNANNQMYYSRGKDGKQDLLRGIAIEKTKDQNADRKASGQMLRGLSGLKATTDLRWLGSGGE